MKKPIEVTVYGAETICAGCHNLPSSRETASWLEAALGRSYGDQVRVRYVDIHGPEGERDAEFSRRVIEEELWYPVVVIDGEVVGEESEPQSDQKKLEQMGAEGWNPPGLNYYRFP